MTESASPESTGAAPVPEAAPLPSPGALLKQARERGGLGVEDLAGQLKLAKGTLEALERDDFASLSEPVYIRGYYRKIAKVLPVSETELINAYNARSRPVPSAPAMRRIPLAGGVAAGSSRHGSGMGFWVVGGVAVALVLVFALADRQPPQRLAEQSAPASVPAPVTEAPLAVAPAPAPSPAPATTTPVPQAPPATGATGAAPAPLAPPAAPAAAPATPNQLVLEFSESSFIRVEDSRAKTLAIGLVRGGERQVLDGQPPYTVFLGNAQNVKVHFNGAPVDFSAHINRQNDTARFTVP